MRPALFVNIHSFIEISFSRLKPTSWLERLPRFFYEVSLFFKFWTDICCDCLLMSYVDTIVFHLFPDLYKNKKMVWSHRLTAKVSLKVFLIIWQKFKCWQTGWQFIFSVWNQRTLCQQMSKGRPSFPQLWQPNLKLDRLWYNNRAQY